MKNKKDRTVKRKTYVFVEIALLVIAIFAFAYIIRDNSDNLTSSNEKDSYNSGAIISNILSLIGKIIFGEKGLVSATSIIETCVENKQGDICQEYSVLNCDLKCKDACVPSRRDTIAECKVGTCYDYNEGTCSVRATKGDCEKNGGKWYDDANGNIPVCEKGCCVVGSQAIFTTERSCNKTASFLGFATDFRKDAGGELGCYSLSQTSQEGACVYESEFDKSCKFATKAECTSTHGEFYSGYLCSNPDLGTTCTKQEKTSCVDGKDEVYWFDSCGNRENIYDANKEVSWNGGTVLNKENSCSLNAKGKDACGNCNYLAGSTCRTENNVSRCDDLRCKDGSGKTRENGESWCEYQSSIGIDAWGTATDEDGTRTQYRSIDTPGSRHFRMVCIDGEVRTESCADYRNEICIESRTPKINNSESYLSNAACRTNRWQECLSYNYAVTSEDTATRNSQETARDEKCEDNPDCFIKEVDVTEGLQFKLCAPRYPPGFDLSSETGSGADSVCGTASQTCKELWIKDMGGEWNCEENCECSTQAFSEYMNDLCISLGDCGTKVNMYGDLTYNHEIYKADSEEGTSDRITFTDSVLTLDADYIAKLKTYKDFANSPNKYATGGDVTNFYSSLGIYDVFSYGTVEDSSDDMTLINSVTGLVGTLLTQMVSVETTIVSSGGAYAATSAASAGVAAAGGALAGAAIGFALVSLLIQLTGISPALGEDGTYALMGAGALGGGLMGVSAGMAASTTATGTLASGFMSAAGEAFSAIGSMSTAGLSAAGAVFLVGFVIMIAIIIFIVVEKILGAGESKDITYSFSCYPWEAPTGGAKCKECGKGGKPCSKYSCEVLGQGCEFINEGSTEEACIYNSKSDVTAPIISPREDSLLPGYQYYDISDNGFKVRSNSSECIKTYEQISFGIELNEPGQCKFSLEHVSSFDKMEYNFGDSVLYKRNHTQSLTIPSLESLGYSSLDPETKVNLDLHVRCKDKNGNKNDAEKIIKICVKPGKDIETPRVTRKEPALGIAAYNETNISATIYVNEPSECRWSPQNSQDYAQMSNNLSCQTSFGLQTIYGWKCSTNFPIEIGINRFYIKCKDQPWLVENDSLRNIMTDSEVFEIERAAGPLNIDSITPDNVTIQAQQEPFSLKVEVKTSGGISGKAQCGFKVNQDSNSYVDFLNTFDSVHSQIFEQFTTGEKIIDVECKDLAGNTANRIARFNLEIDTSAPIVTRIYSANNNLYIITDEKSECRFSNDDALGCSFDWNNATLIGGDSMAHSSVFSNKYKYYIKCKDAYGNVASECSAVVKGGGEL